MEKDFIAVNDVVDIQRAVNHNLTSYIPLSHTIGVYTVMAMCPIGLITNVVILEILRRTVGKYSHQMRPAIPLFGTVAADGLRMSIMGAHLIFLSLTLENPAVSFVMKSILCKTIAYFTQCLQTFSVWCLLLMSLNQLLLTFPCLFNRRRSMRHARSDAAGSSEDQIIARQMAIVAIVVATTHLHIMATTDYHADNDECSVALDNWLSRWMNVLEPLLSFIVPVAMIAVTDTFLKHKQNSEIRTLQRRTTVGGTGPDGMSANSSALQSSGISISSRSASVSIASVVGKARVQEEANKRSRCSIALEVPGQQFGSNNQIARMKQFQQTDSVSSNSSDVRKRKLRRLKRSLQLCNKFISLTWLDLLLAFPHAVFKILYSFALLNPSTPSAELGISIGFTASHILYCIQFTLNWLYLLVLWPHFEKQLRTATLRELKDVTAGRAAAAVCAGTGETTQEKSVVVTSVGAAVMEPINMAAAITARRARDTRASARASKRSFIHEIKRLDSGIRL